MKTKIIKVHPDFPEYDKLSECARIVCQGGLVIFPTETVYGIAADRQNPKAMKRLVEVKKRSENKPFSVCISQKGLIVNYTPVHNKPVLYKLIDEFWPGPLTVVVPGFNDGESVGVRVPNHKIAIKFLEECKCQVAAPSANFEGNPAPMTCEEALRDLDGLVDVAIDGGRSTIGLGSTVVDVTKDKVKVLREGPISESEINRVSSRKTILFICTGNSCRSVMAEYLLRSYVGNKNNIEVISAGTGVFIHSKASSETVAVLSQEGIDATRHLSQPVTNILLKKADLIVVMTRSHRRQVLERAPEVENRVYLLREFSSSPSSFHTDLDIPDPIGQSHEAYQECLSVIKESILKLKDLV